ncbi:MAG: reverse transcriptase-like protein [Anaerolineae bacterium]
MAGVTLIVLGGSRGNPGAGYGSYAVIRGNERRITRIEFGGTMTNNEAEYDTLITALRTLLKAGAADDMLDIQSANQVVAKQLRRLWKASDPALRMRYMKAKDLLGQFKGWKVTRISREQAAHEVASSAR